MGSSKSKQLFNLKIFDNWKESVSIFASFFLATQHTDNLASNADVL
jgi:hypothetical protein